jgi:DNA primase
MLATVNPRNNLAHCFGCKKNLNNIDLLLTLGYDFKTAVSILVRMYDQHRSRLACAETPMASRVDTR